MDSDSIGTLPKLSRAVSLVRERVQELMSETTTDECIGGGRDNVRPKKW